MSVDLNSKNTFYLRYSRSKISTNCLFLLKFLRNQRYKYYQASTLKDPPLIYNPNSTLLVLWRELFNISYCIKYR